MKFSLEKTTTLFYSLTLIVLATLLGIYFYNTQTIKTSNNLLAHTQDVLSKSNVVLLDVINVETSSRGFALTGDETFLNPYNKAVHNSKKNISALQLLTKNNPYQQIRVESLKTKIAERLYLSKLIIEESRDNIDGLKGNDIRINMNKGKIITDTIRKLISEINEAENILLKQQKIDNGRSTFTSDMLLFALFLLITTVTILIFYIIKSQKKRNKELALFHDIQKLASQYSLSLIEASLDPLITINTEGKITDTNEATVKITGIEKIKLIGSDFFDYFTEHQKAREVYQAVFKTGSVSDYPLTILHKDGKLTDVLFNGSVYKDDLGNILGVVVVARDIAEQKWALDLRDANKKLAFQNDEKENRANELLIANKELAFQNEEKEKRAQELAVANKELEYQNDEKEMWCKRATA